MTEELPRRIDYFDKRFDDLRGDMSQQFAELRGATVSSRSPTGRCITTGVSRTR